MARIEDGNLSGAIGTIVFYTMNGKTYARQRPGKRTKKRGSPVNPNTDIFGKVSRAGSGMLKLLKLQLLFRLTLGSYNNGRGWMRNHYAANHDKTAWPLATRPNDMCQLNPAADLRDMLFTSIALEDRGKGMIAITIPSMNPKKDMKKLPLHTIAINMKLAVLHASFERASQLGIHVENHRFSYTDELLPGKQIVIDTKAAAGRIAIVVLAIEPEIRSGVTIEKEWLPVGIIGMGRLK